jgi:3',5'-cyclic AMP phosphodiesterase CpdA
MRWAAELSQKTQGKTVVAHISDLHFRSDTSTRGYDLQALETSLRTINPDLLVVTGDLIDGYIGDMVREDLIKQALSNVRRYVESLCHAVGLDPEKSLFIIPGNHDYRIQGLFFKSALVDWFDEEFRKYSEPGLFPGLRTVIFCFDSNSPDSGINLAMGLVCRERLTEFESIVDRLKADDKARWFECTRIALLHHHPMPIAPTEGSARITDRDEFLLLRNSGSFMEQMGREKIHLVLHGHKHYPSLSKVIFPKEGSIEHTIAVIAAGSVCRPPSQFCRSFNTVTMHNTGEIELERSDLEANSYQNRAPLSIRSYEEARNGRFAERRATAAVEADRYARSDWIEDGSGDIEMFEEFRGVRSIGKEAVSTLEHEMSSKSARFGDRSYSVKTPNHSMEWKWLGDQDSSGNRKAKTIFTPPLEQDPIDFDRNGTVYNAIHFSREDRLDVTGQASATENVSITVRQAYETMAFQVVFPDTQWPNNIQLIVLNESGKPDYREREYCAQFFTPISQTHSVIFMVNRPLLGYTYMIDWSLPEKDMADFVPDATDAGVAEELIQNFLAAREDNSPCRKRLNAALTKLSILVRQLLPSSQAGQDDLEITIYCYDRQKRGLVCVATEGVSGSVDWAAVIRPGERIDGQAYKRRESLLFVNIPGVAMNSAYYIPPKGYPVHTVVCSVPLFFPLGTGRRIGVVTFAARSNTTGLFKLQSKLPSNETCLLKLVEQLNAWLVVDGGPALGLKLLLD